MGLQFIDADGTERTLTVADMMLPDFADSYSDLYKGINGFRPRGHSPETMLHFFDTYEAQLAEHLEEEKRQLAYVSERDGVAYTSWMHYYDVKEQRDNEAWLAEKALKDAKLAHQAEFIRRGSPLPVIEAWEHGTL